MSFCYFFPRPHCLNEEEQLFLTGCTSQSVVNGPGVFFVGPFHSGDRRRGVPLKKTDFLKVQDSLSGEVNIRKGPQLYFYGPFEDTSAPQSAISLGPTDYLKVEDEQTGDLRVEKGPQLWFPGPYDKYGRPESAVPLKHNEYVKILDTKSGAIRVETGENLVWPEATEIIMEGGVKQAVNLDEHTAVLVRNTENGQLRLVTGRKLFFPGPREEIEKIQSKIVLEDHQVVIIKNKEGRYMFREGKNTNIYVDNEEDSQEENEIDKFNKDVTSKDGKRSFFLPPYCELVSLQWWASEDIKHKTEKVTHFDLRPQFMTYEFVCRTCDNVELRIDLTFFWEINDIRKMIHKTDDLPGDICNHARSVIIQNVSQVTLEKFMQDFNAIVGKAVLGSEDTFYDERGAVVHTVEVRSIHCVDPSTEKVLQEIIKETTDRLNRLQKQASENEVKLFKMKGDIEEEKLNGELLMIRKDHQRAESQIEGESQAFQIKSFLKGLDTHNVPFDQQLQMWHTLRRIDGIKVLADGNSTMYFTPNDVNLSIETLNAHSMGKMKKQDLPCQFALSDLF